MKLNLDKLKSFNQQKCKTSLLIERNSLFFIRPEWNESFPIQRSGVSELNVIIMTDLGESVEAKSIASTFLGVEELRSKGHEQDNHAIPLSQEMNPKGKIKLMVTFHSKESKLKRRKAVCDKVYIHNGHRYIPSYFKFFTHCAYCHVSRLLKKGKLL